LKADEAFSEHVTELINMSVDKMTDDEIARLEKDAAVAQKELSYWQKTTAQKEFIKDIKAI
ncbi:hypothetical protein ACX6XY_30365, partial [Streptomyces sp. O3]